MSVLSQALAVILAFLHDLRQRERVSQGRGSLQTLSCAVCNEEQMQEWDIWEVGESKSES